MFASSWQKMAPTSNGGSTASLSEQTYTSVKNNNINGDVLTAGNNSRSMPWPRNCFRLIVYGAVISIMVFLILFFISQRSSQPDEPPLMPNSDDDEMTAFKHNWKRHQQQRPTFFVPTLKELLSKNRIPNVAHYVWCESGYFEFKHYLSVQSVIKFMRPDLVIFHLTNEPAIDPLGYNDWWDRLKRDTPFLIVHQLPLIDGNKNCSEDVKFTNDIFNNHVRNEGGVYFASNGVVLTSRIDLNLPPEQQSITFDFPGNDKSNNKDLPAVILMRPKTSGDFVSSSTECSIATTDDDDNNNNDKLPFCLFVRQTGDAVALYPRDIWAMSTQFGKMARSLIYDTEDVIAPVPQPNTLVPLICHYIWLGGGTVDFLLYLSILSCLNVLKADAAILHGEIEPAGPLWQELLAMGDSRLHYVYRPQQHTMYGTPVKQLMAMSDVLRTDILLKYGGIYVDWDAIFVKPFDAEIRSYSAVVAPDWPEKLKPWPWTLNLGVMLAKPGSLYVKHLQAAMADYADGVGPLQWCFICLRAYKVLEMYPETARLEPHLQVMSYLGRYHPAWQPGAGNDMFDGKFDWRSETYAVHWTFPTPKELRSKVGLVKTNSTVAADIARFVLQSSGINI